MGAIGIGGEAHGTGNSLRRVADIALRVIFIAATLGQNRQQGGGARKVNRPPMAKNRSGKPLVYIYFASLSLRRTCLHRR